MHIETEDKKREATSSKQLHTIGSKKITTFFSLSIMAYTSTVHGTKKLKNWIAHGRHTPATRTDAPNNCSLIHFL